MRTKKIPKTHPRAESLRVREKVKEGYTEGIMVENGMISHGRGEAFDYLLGELTIPEAFKATKVAAATLLLANNPIISVNGNVATLAPKEVVKLAESVGAKIEVNLFHRTLEREIAIMKKMKTCGAKEVLGVGKAASSELKGLESSRRWVDPEGIMTADTVLAPLEDGDRTATLRKAGKTVITIDLNPLSRTAQTASITIVDNIVRAMPLIVEESTILRKIDKNDLKDMIKRFDNKVNLNKSLGYIINRLEKIAATRVNSQ